MEQYKSGWDDPRKMTDEELFAECVDMWVPDSLKVAYKVLGKEKADQIAARVFGKHFIAKEPSPDEV